MSKQAKIKERRQDESALTALMQGVTEELTRRYEASSAIERGGTKIVLPEYMTLKDGYETLYQHYQSAEEETETKLEFNGHIDDCLHAFYRAMSNVFGQLTGVAEKKMTFFGPVTVKRAQSKTITTNYNETEMLPIGLVAAPGLPVGIEVELAIDDVDAMNSWLHVHCSYIRKFQPLVDMIRDETNRMLASESIFLKKAVNSRFEFINLNGFPLDRIVYTDAEHAQLQAHLFTPIEHRRRIVDAGIQIKRTVLLSGPFGTGKTLTALKCANLCVNNGWTFINVLPGHDVKTAFNFAQRYQPAMVFCEDIDQLTNAGEKRGAGVNEILNTMDGLLSKSAEVMTIVTTNNVEAIERAMTRPGRIDAIIALGAVDASNLQRLVVAYCGAQLGESVDVERLLPLAVDYTPAFIAEACNRALLYSLARDGESITNDDLAAALDGLRAQYDLMISDAVIEKPTIDKLLHQLVGSVTGEVISAEVTGNGLANVVNEQVSDVITTYDLEYVNDKLNDIRSIVEDISESV